MKFQSLRLNSSLLAIATLSSTVALAENNEPVTLFSDTEIEVGLLNVSDESFRFGRYTGLTDNDTYLNLNFSMSISDGISQHATFTGRDLGLDSRSLYLDWGKQGQYDAYIHYDQIPFNNFIGQTIFEGVGSNNLTLPAGWVNSGDTHGFSQLDKNLKDVEIGTLRKKLALGTRVLNLRKNLTLTLDFSTENKEGYQTLGSLVGGPGSGGASLLPAPIDYTTNTLSAALGYVNDKGHFNLSYLGSMFFNDNNRLSWESPFSAEPQRGSEGQMSVAPDNQMHQLSFSGGYRLTDTTHFTGLASVAMMLQDDAFLPDTVSPNVPNITPHSQPRNSLDGEVYQYNALLSLSSRPLRGLNLKGSYRLLKRDNQTPRDEYTWYLNDSFNPPSINIETKTNDPYSYTKQTYKLDAGYRINSTARLSGYIGHETYESDQSEVEETTEDKGELKLGLRATDNLQLSLGGKLSSRDGSSYDSATDENPVLRKYNIADRDRVGGIVNVAYQPTDKFALSANLDYNDDDYDDTVIGLTDAKQTGITIDASYQFNKDLSGYAYAGREVYKSKQAGSQTTVDAANNYNYAIAVTPDWWVDNEDTVDSFGVGFSWLKSSKLELGADYVVSLSEGDTDFKSTNAAPIIEAFPDTEAHLHSINLYAEYEWRKDTHVKISYLYEKYDEDDWSIDGVTYDTIPEALLLGEPNPSYEEHVVGVSLKTIF